MMRSILPDDEGRVFIVKIRGLLRELKGICKDAVRHDIERMRVEQEELKVKIQDKLDSIHDFLEELQKNGGMKESDILAYREAMTEVTYDFYKKLHIQILVL